MKLNRVHLIDGKIHFKFDDGREKVFSKPTSESEAEEFKTKISRLLSKYIEKDIIKNKFYDKKFYSIIEAYDQILILLPKKYWEIEI